MRLEWERRRHRERPRSRRRNRSKRTNRKGARVMRWSRWRDLCEKP